MSVIAELVAWVSGLGAVVVALGVAWFVLRVVLLYLWLRRRDRLDLIPVVGTD